MSKWSFLNADLIELHKTEKSNSVLAQALFDKHKKTITESKDLPNSVNAIRKYVEAYLRMLPHDALKDECEASGIPIEDVKHYWYKGEHFSIFVKGQKIRYEDIRDDMIKEMRQYAPKYPKITYPKIKDEHLLVIDPADIHIGKLATAFETGEDYNSQVAVLRVKEGLQGILNKVRGFNIDKILFIVGNDILHVDNPKRTTTSGTGQDTDGMWYTNFLIAKQLYIDCLEILMTIAPVTVQYDPSNHDYQSGFFLADSLSSWFSKCPNIDFRVSIAHRKYFVYHTNLIGTTHGDGAKEQDLPLLMAHEAKEDWGNTKHKYFYTHHIHHKRSKDYMGVCVESLRSPSGADSWHSRNGYDHAPKAVEAFIHHPLHGQVCRITHIF